MFSASPKQFDYLLAALSRYDLISFLTVLQVIPGSYPHLLKEYYSKYTFSPEEISEASSLIRKLNNHSKGKYSHFLINDKSNIYELKKNITIKLPIEKLRCDENHMIRVMSKHLSAEGHKKFELMQKHLNDNGI